MLLTGAIRPGAKIQRLSEHTRWPPAIRYRRFPKSARADHCPWQATSDTEGDAGAGAVFADAELGGDAGAEFGHVADDAYGAAAVAEAVEDVHDLVEGVLVEGAEAFVHEEGADLGAAGLGGDDVGQA